MMLIQYAADNYLGVRPIVSIVPANLMRGFTGSFIRVIVYLAYCAFCGALLVDIFIAFLGA